MSDPFRIFREESEHKREIIKQVWPELYAALAQLDAGKRATWGCAMPTHDGMHGGPREYRPVVARLWLNGFPACAECIARGSDRPGGYPLDRIDPKEWRG